MRLYSGGLEIADTMIDEIVNRTQNVSASFIEELMRRAAQFHLAKNGSNALTIEDGNEALNEMLFSGGSLNVKLLGAEAWSEVASSPA